MLRYALAAAIALAPALAFSAPKKVNVDTGSSVVKWVGSKALVDSKHNGTVKLANSSFLNVEGDKITGGQIVVDMNTIANEDQTDATYKAKLEGHLKGDDFFAVDKYKEAKFVIKTVTPQADGTQVFDGDMTIRDVTNPAKVVATVKKDGKALVANGKLDIDRTKYNVKYGSNAFFPDLVKKGKDKIIADQIALEFNVKTAAK